MEGEKACKRVWSGEGWGVGDVLNVEVVEVEHSLSHLRIHSLAVVSLVWESWFPSMVDIRRERGVCDVLFARGKVDVGIVGWSLSCVGIVGGICVRTGSVP